jgi:hypothetical protein
MKDIKNILSTASHKTAKMSPVCIHDERIMRMPLVQLRLQYQKDAVAHIIIIATNYLYQLRVVDDLFQYISI